MNHPALYATLITFIAWKIYGITETERRRRMTNYALNGLLTTRAILAIGHVLEFYKAVFKPKLLFALFLAHIAKYALPWLPRSHRLTFVVFAVFCPLGALSSVTVLHETIVKPDPVKVVILAKILDWVFGRIVGWFVRLVVEDLRLE